LNTSVARYVSIVLLACAAMQLGAAEKTLPAFPGAQGWAAQTPGGRGGKIIRVTTLAPEGPGSFVAALEARGPRIVVFEVGGIVNLDLRTVTIREPFLTIAGQTAPSPGVTFIRGGFTIATHDVVVQHIRVRPGEAGKPKMSGWEIDALTTGGGARDVIVDHCSFSWATDENLSASGPRFKGNTPAEWREGASHRITFSNNIIAEGLANATHSKGEHSKGTLVHDNVTDVLIVGNLYAHNVERNPLFKGGARGLVVNNLIYDPGTRAAHYNLISAEWEGHAPEPGRVAFIGNVLRAGPSTATDIAFFMLGGSGDVELHDDDNIMVDRLGRPLLATGRYTTGTARIKRSGAPALPEGVTVMRATDVEESVLRNAGARPWDRDIVDRRILADTAEGRGRVIDSEQEVGGYPTQTSTNQPFDESQWDLRFMTPVKAR
jgi:pectate lyase